MGKIIEFRYPAGYAASLPEDYTIRNKYLPEPRRKIISFLEAKQALELGAVKREILRETAGKPAEPPVSRKRPLVISALPGETIPAEYPDLRPFLQRDGLILLSWARWGNYRPFGVCYRVNWVKSCGKCKRYCSGFITDISDKRLSEVMPGKHGDLKYREGIMGRNLTDVGYVTSERIADIVFLAAPDLSALTRPFFIQKLKEAGSAVNFDFDFSLGLAKELEYKKQAAEIEALKIKGGQNG